MLIYDPEELLLLLLLPLLLLLLLLLLLHECLWSHSQQLQTSTFHRNRNFGRRGPASVQMSIHGRF
jgi:hypothetical protein